MITHLPTVLGLHSKLKQRKNEFCSTTGKDLPASVFGTSAPECGRNEPCKTLYHLLSRDLVFQEGAAGE